MPFGLFTVRQYLAQFQWLREQYLTRHLKVRLSGCALESAEGDVLGYVEEVALLQNRLIVRGWARVKSATFRLGPTVRQLRPHLERSDVSTAFGCDPHVGFSVSLPFFDDPLQIELIVQGGGRVVLTHPLNVERGRNQALRALKLQFWRELVPMLPMIAAGLRRADPDLRRRLKTALRLDQGRSVSVLDARFLASPDARAAADQTAGQAVTIILPVFNAFSLLPEVLARVAAHTDLPWHLIVIEDKSTDPAVRPWLRDWVRAQPEGRVTLLENDINQGFIRSVNRGFDAVVQGDVAGPVILLNSDAMVPQGWASRLVAHLRSSDVASVTPLSNDAEIFSAPVICKNSQLEAGQADRIDAILRNSIAGADAPQVVAPTGVGFCMAIGPGWIARVGRFDTQFGRGYGEEVDWCRRAAALGGLHVAATDLFVEHRGGASFGDEKLALVQQNNAVITTRYPGYDRSVQEFIRTDPLATPRLLAALAYVDGLAGVEEIPVYIAHSLGGGADHYLQSQISQRPVSVTLRFGGAERCQIELETGLGRLVAACEDLALVVRLISAVSKRRIVYSCAVGDPDLREMPGLLLALSDGAPLEVLFHDYLPVSPSYTLLDQDGVFRGVPKQDTTDAAHLYRCPDGGRITLAAWQALWGAALEVADRLVVFSQASARILAQSYPKAADRIVIRPHQIAKPTPRLPQPTGAGKVIAVLGAIGPQKGAAIVSALSLIVQGRQDMGLVLIGYIAPGFNLAADTVVHGRYDPEDIASLAQHYGVTHWLIPSIWPETFSYAVHECLATGLPTLAFDLGAQGDAVKAAQNGLAVAWPADLVDAKTHGRMIVAQVMDGLPAA